MSTSSEWPLAGLRVIDLSSEIAGPYCAKILVDAGADVIKVESPDEGDPLRRWTASGAAIAEGEDGALFQHLNASKRSVTADLESDGGRSLVLDLAATCDLTIESFAPGTMERLGLSLETLQERNPALSLVSISPWGGSGPWANRPATEFTLQAATGATDHRGLSGRVPVGAGGRIGEWIAGTYGAVGAVTAWLSARNTGRGQHVDLSMFEAMLLSMTYYLDLGSQWREGLLHRGIEVPSIEPAKDGWVGFCTVTGQQWKDFCVLIEQPEIGADDRYLDGTVRTESIELLHGVIHAWTRERTVEEIVELANLLRIPAVPVGDGQRLPQMDQFQERGVFLDGPGGFLRPRPTGLLEKTPARPFGPAPKLGEHNGEVEAELASAQPLVTAGEGGTALPLTGLRVVELSTFWAGPIAGCYLADMGADVIKVESIQRPDGMRFAGAIPTDRMWEWSAVFAGVNVGKRDVTLQLDGEEGMALIKQLIENADVVIENYSARVVENFGLGWDVVHEINPRAIMMRMPAFGLDGPWRDRAGFAMTVEQVSGLAWITGYEDIPLVVRGACDPVSGMHAVFALMMALEHRRRTGEGQLVEASLVESALNVACEQVIEYSAYGEILTRTENRGPYAAPQGIYPCAGDDAYLTLAVVTDEQWQGLRTVLGDPEWARDPSLKTAAGRRAAHDDIDVRLAEWCARYDRDETVEKMITAGVPANALVNGHRVWPNPQLEARDFFHFMEHPVTGETRYPGQPMSFSAFPRQLHPSPPPTLGQNNDEVLSKELGLSEEEITGLRERKVIGERPTFM